MKKNLKICTFFQSKNDVVHKSSVLLDTTNWPFEVGAQDLRLVSVIKDSLSVIDYKWGVAWIL